MIQIKKLFFSIITTLFFIYLFLFLLSSYPLAQEKISASSASLLKENFLSGDKLTEEFFFQKLAIVKILQRYNSPLLPYANIFLAVSNRFELDPYLLPAIAGLESYFGNRLIPYTYNPFGWRGGLYYFPDYPTAIFTVGQALREKYIDRGADTIEKIGAIYAESPTWAYKVRKIILLFEREERELRLLFDVHTIK